MYIVFLAIIVGFVSLLLAEYINKHNLFPKEVSRKLPHIIISALASVLPFFVSYEVIVIGSLGVLAITTAAKYLGFFSRIREIGRLSWGEFFIPLGVIGAALMEPNDWVFCAAILMMGLADAAAAIIGTKYGKHNFVYLGHKKSLEGSAAFLVSALIITALLLFVVPSGLASVPAIMVLAFPVVITAVEALAPYGTDNLFIPVITAAFFTLVF